MQVLFRNLLKNKAKSAAKKTDKRIDTSTPKSEDSGKIDRSNKAEAKKEVTPDDEAPKKKHTDDIDQQRQEAANADTGRARGRNPSSLGELENASSNRPGTRIEDSEIEDINKKRGPIKEILEEKEGKSYEEQIGTKKLDDILEKGPRNKEGEWSKPFEPNNDGQEFRAIEDESGINRTIKLLKTDSQAALTPSSPLEQKINLPPKLDDNEIPSPEKTNGSKPNVLNPNDVVIKSSKEVSRIENDSFLDNIQHEAEVNESFEQLELDMGNEIGDDFDFDFD